MQTENIYHEAFVGNLFDRMARTYGIVNYLASFGFSERWRRQCVDEIHWSDDTRVVFDLMSGMGECWGLILSRGRRVECITGVDISAEMNRRAAVNLVKRPAWPVELRQENILQNSIPSDSADVLVSAFGLKTFSEQQLERLAAEMSRILKPGGQVAVIEISTPKPWLLRVPYLFYLKWVIPVIGALFMGNPDTYSMLGRYCSNFGTCLSFHEKLRKAGLEVTYREYFFGCATGVVGRKSS
jgi:ubiquinone/menaquinone biosynthesis methyltransferase